MSKDPLKDLQNLDLSPYTGEWIALCDAQVVSHGKKMKEVYYDARQKCPGKNPFLTRIPGKETWLF